MKKRNEKIISVVNKMMNSLDQGLLNQDLLDFIKNGLNANYDPNYDTTNFSDNMVLIQGRKKSDTFSICLEPSIEEFSKITITTSHNENHEESKVTIDFSDGEHIKINEEIITKLRNTDNIIMSIGETRKETIYRYNALCYYRKYNSILNMHCNNNDALTTLEELIIEDDLTAVKRVMHIQDGCNLGSIKYYESNHYETQPFNTRVNHFDFKSSTMLESTEETYNQFVANLKDKKLLERK